jgi:hypothetical protein
MFFFFFHFLRVTLQTCAVVSSWLQPCHCLVLSVGGKNSAVQGEGGDEEDDGGGGSGASRTGG